MAHVLQNEADPVEEMAHALQDRAIFEDGILLLTLAISLATYYAYLPRSPTVKPSSAVYQYRPIPQKYQQLVSLALILTNSIVYMVRIASVLGYSVIGGQIVWPQISKALLFLMAETWKVSVPQKRSTRLLGLSFLTVPHNHLSDYWDFYEYAWYSAPDTHLNYDLPGVRNLRRYPIPLLDPGAPAFKIGVGLFLGGSSDTIPHTGDFLFILALISRFKK